MTDLEKTKAHFLSMGVTLTQISVDEHIILSSHMAESTNKEHSFDMGCMGFTADLFFTPNGDFAGMGGFE